MFLDIFSKGSWTNGVWSMSGDQGNSWKIATINLSNWASDTVTFRWRGTTGNDDLSDMALDAINIAGPSTVGLNELRYKQKFSVFPNPGTDEFNVVIPSNTNSDLVYSITDISGRVILSGTAQLKSGDSSAKINMQAFAAGVYTIRLSYDGKVEYTKLYKI
jgi:hypothetical protein